MVGGGRPEVFTEGDLHHPGVRWGNVGSESRRSDGPGFTDGHSPVHNDPGATETVFRKVLAQSSLSPAVLTLEGQGTAKTAPDRWAAGGQLRLPRGLCPLTLILAGFLLAFPCLPGRPAWLPAAA